MADFKLWWTLCQFFRKNGTKIICPILMRILTIFQEVHNDRVAAGQNFESDHQQSITKKTALQSTRR